MIALLIAAVCNGLGNFFLKVSSDEGGRAVLPFLGGCGLFATSVFFYTSSLKKFPLTVAYPTMFAVAAVLASVMAHFFFGESFTVLKGIGVTLITLGVLFLMGGS